MSKSLSGGIRPFFGVACAGMLAMLNVHAAESVPPQEPPLSPGSETVVVLPDTEVYASRKPGTFRAQLQWIRDRLAARRIVAVLHVGDITNRNTDPEWQVARSSFDLIEGKIPYVLAFGNHDFDGQSGRTSLGNKYFKVSELSKWPGFGEVFEPNKLDNHYQWITIQGRKWLALSLEMGPRNAVIDWANAVLTRYADSPVIVVTHAYLFRNNERYDYRRGYERASPHGAYGEGADGEELWNRLIRKHRNVMIVTCGHVASGYAGYRRDEGDYGNTVHQMLCDYESLKGGGQGFLRLLEFLPDGKTVQVRTYSPVTHQINPVNPAVETYTFELGAPTRREPKPALPADVEPLTRGPIHRFSFNGEGGDGAVLVDDVGKNNGIIRAPKGDARLNGQGQLVLDARDGGFGDIGPQIAGRQKVSVEVWFTPTTNVYNWAHVVDFGGSTGDRFWYGFRTFNNHRAEMVAGGHNQDIQTKGVPVEVGKPAHVVMTYDENGGPNGTPLLSSYFNGFPQGAMQTGIKLSALAITNGCLGPFAGLFDDVRVYDYPLSAKQVRGNYMSGPEAMTVAP